MLKIIASDSDLSANAVIEWLLYWGIPFERYSNATFQGLSNHDLVWMRYVVDLGSYDYVFSQNFSTKSEINDAAVFVGLQCPKTHQVSSKEEVEDLLLKGHNVVIKPSAEVTSISTSDGTKKYANYTTQLSLEKLRNMGNLQWSDYFVQEYIAADFEVRTIVIDGVVKSAAMMKLGKGSEDVKDIRYEVARNNVLHQEIDLPQHVEQGLLELFRKLNIQFGCVDWLVRGSNFYFLEINQVGQFEGTSNQANLLAIQTIAEYIKARWKEKYTMRK